VDNIKMDLREIRWRGMVLTDLVEVKNWWRDLVYAVMNTENHWVWELRPLSEILSN
jgi:hypothetical protein